MALVLLVLDEPDTLLTLRRQLEAAGHRTLLAADADTALERVVHFPVDVVVLDVVMPVGDGWGVLKALRHQQDPPPVIVASRHAGPEHLERARQMGAVDAITAPNGPEELIRAVAHAVAEWPRHQATAPHTTGTA
jgi:two-component system response regulator PrrA